MATYLPNQLFQVPLAELQPDPAQPRKYMDPVALDEMTASVGQVGIIQPIVCRQDPATGLVYVVAGERRCAAARKAGLPTVPAVFIEGGNYAEIALVENLLRQDLNPVEEAEALQRLMDGTPTGRISWRRSSANPRHHLGSPLPQQAAQGDPG